MNKFLLPILISTVLISGCKNPFEAKDKGVNQLDNIESRWDDAYTLASSTSRIALATPVSNLQEIKRDLAQIEISECLIPAREALSNHMDIEINTFLKFMSNKESTETQKIMERIEANTQLKEYFSSKAKCTGEESTQDAAADVSAAALAAIEAASAAEAAADAAAEAAEAEIAAAGL